MPDPLAVRIERIIERAWPFEDNLTALGDDAAAMLRRWKKCPDGYAGIKDLKMEHTGEYPSELHEAEDAIIRASHAIEDALGWAIAARNALKCAAQEAKHA